MIFFDKAVKRKCVVQRGLMLGAWVSVVASCSSDTFKAQPTPPTSVPTSQHPNQKISPNPSCVDVDRDGYGDHCEKGADCNDRDPTLALECGPQDKLGACSSAEPPRPCYSMTLSQGAPNSIACKVGHRTCENGAWSVCKVDSTYIKTWNAIATGPSVCNPCDPACRTDSTFPDSSDLTPDNHTDVVYDPVKGGLVINPTSTGGNPASWYVDTDGDSIPDVVDPFPSDNAKDGYSEIGGIIKVLPYQGPAVNDSLDIKIQVRSADIYFLMDTTGSMQQEIDNLKTAITGTLIDQIRVAIPDSQMGVGYFDDFPVPSFGEASSANCYHAPTNTPHDVPYQNLQTITSDDDAVRAAVGRYVAYDAGRTTPWCGGDLPESPLDALRAVASGTGIPDLRSLDAVPYTPAGAFLSGTVTNVSGNDTLATAYNLGTLDGTYRQIKATLVGLTDNVDDKTYGGLINKVCGYSVTSNNPDAYYKFHLDAPQTVRVYTLTKFETTSPAVEGFDHGIRLLDSLGTSEVDCFVDYSDAGLSSSHSWRGVYKVLPLAAGDHYIVVDANNAPTKDYYLFIGTQEAPGESRESPLDLGTLTTGVQKYQFQSEFLINNDTDNTAYLNNSDSCTWKNDQTDAVIKFTITQRSPVLARLLDRDLWDTAYPDLHLLKADWSKAIATDAYGCREFRWQHHGATYYDVLEPGTYYLMGWVSEADELNFEVGIPDTFYTPSPTACPPGTRGYPCFRSNAVPLVLLITDARAHGGISGGYGAQDMYYYDTTAPFAGDLDGTVWALNQQGIKVIGIGANDAPQNWCRDDCVGWDPPVYECRPETYCENYDQTNTCTSWKTENVCQDWYDCNATQWNCGQSYEGGEEILRYLATQTGAVCGEASADLGSPCQAAGDPFFYRVGTDGSGLDSQVVNAITDLAEIIRMDVSLRINDNPSTAVDERQFIQSITTVPTAETSARCLATHATWYEKCLPGTHTQFSVTLKNDIVPSTAAMQVFDFSIDAMGDSIYLLGTTPARVIVPPDFSAVGVTQGSFSKDYDATAACGPGLLPTWTTLSWTASTPSDAYITWEIRAADTVAGLNAATPVTFSTPPSTSPRTLTQDLAAANQSSHATHLRLKAILHAASDGVTSPVLEQFDVESRCESPE